MTGPSDIPAAAGGSYPGPMSALGPDSAAFVLFTPTADALLATADGGQTWQEQFARPTPTR